MQSPGEGRFWGKGELHAPESMTDNLEKPADKLQVQHSAIIRKKRKRLLQEKQNTHVRKHASDSRNKVKCHLFSDMACHNFKHLIDLV